MTLVDAPPSRRSNQRLIIAAATVALLTAGGVTAVTYYYDSVPLVEHSVSYPVVAVAELPDPVAKAFVAAVDADFPTSEGSLITRRYVAPDAGSESGLRSRVLVDKAEATWSKDEILSRYLNEADYGRGAVGLVAAAQTYFQKPAARLTVAEAARLAVQLHPGRPAPEAGWAQVLDTMVERGWLTPAERAGVTFPG